MHARTGEILSVSSLVARHTGQDLSYKDLDLDELRDVLAGQPHAVIMGEANFRHIAFLDKEIELLAELEHGRWNIERLHDGWRYGKTKDEDRKLNPCLVRWTDLPDGENGVKKYDRNAVRAFPEILAKAGLEVFRR